MAVRKSKAVLPEGGKVLKSASTALPTNGRARAARDVPPARDVPATSGMLAELRNEMLGRFESVDKRFESVEKLIDGVECRLMAKFPGIKADVARISFLIEEQNARNKVVLDALMSVLDQQGRLAQRMDMVEETVRALAKTRPAA